MAMHITQRSIIAKLMYAETLRYSEVKPKGMAGNQFAYHLEGLVKDELVEKTEDNLYTLTIKGKQLTDKLSHKTFHKTNQPKLVAMALIKNLKGETMFHKRHRQPFSEMWNLPYAKIRFEEHPEDSIERVVKKRLLLTDLVPKASKNISLNVYEKPTGELITSLMAVLFECDVVVKDTYNPISDHYEFFTPRDLPVDNTFPGIKELVMRCAEDESFVSIDAYI